MITAVVVILTLQLLSYIAMVVAMVFDKSRLVNLFFLACMTFGGVALVLSFIGMLLNL